MGRDRFEAEFGVYTDWLVQAIVAANVSDRVPAACRGTGNPHLLRHLAERVGARPGMRFLDVGCGIGGPSAWLARERGAAVFGVDVMHPGAAGARRLFPNLHVAVASSRALPFANETFDAAWALGVIEMIEHKDEALADVHRVLRPRGRFALYGFVARAEFVEGAPAADHFVTPAALEGALAFAGFVTLESGPYDAPALPEEWSSIATTVREELRRARGGRHELELVDEELGRFNRLRSRGEIEPWTVVAEKADDGEGR